MSDFGEANDFSSVYSSRTSHEADRSVRTSSDSPPTLDMTWALQQTSHMQSHRGLYSSAQMVKDHVTQQQLDRHESLLYYDKAPLNELNLTQLQQQHLQQQQQQQQQQPHQQQQYHHQQQQQQQYHHQHHQQQQQQQHMPPLPISSVFASMAFDYARGLNPPQPQLQPQRGTNSNSNGSMNKYPGGSSSGGAGLSRGPHGHEPQHHQHQHQHQHQMYSSGGSQAGGRPVHSKKLRQPSYSDPVLLDLCSLEDSSLEDIVVKSCRVILQESSRSSLKAVELANYLRARVGADVLSHIRERWGGLLLLLERYPARFRVERIPKNDIVSLVGAPPSAPQLPAAHSVPFLASPVKAATRQAAARNSDVWSGDQDSIRGVGRIVLDVERQSSSVLVGKISALHSEEQLAQEFDRYGEVEHVRVIEEDGQRFALVRFATVEQAVAAKQRIAKLPQYTGQVMFAHVPQPAAPAAIEQEPFPDWARAQAPPQQQQQQQQQQPHQQQYLPRPPLAQPQAQDHALSFLSMVGSGFPAGSSLLPGMLLEGDDAPSALGMSAPVLSAHDLGLSAFEAPPLSQPWQAKALAPHIMPPPGLSSVSASRPAPLPAPVSAANLSCPVAARLTDADLKPTDQWPADPAVDGPYLSSLVVALQRSNGMGTIPYLRAFLPNVECLAVSQSALKALLLAYPGTFSVRGNQCSLGSMDLTTADRISCWF